MSSEVVLIVHALLGFLALATVIMITVKEKGGEVHKALGNFFIVTTVAAAMAGSVVAIAADKFYFLNIASAAVLQIVLGNIVLKNRSFTLGVKESFVLSAFSLVALTFFLYGTSITTALGLMYLLLSSYQWYNFLRKEKTTKFYWLAQHISNMLGAGLSVLTAFIVGNIGVYSLVGFVWVIPAILGILLVRYFRLKYAPTRPLKIGKFKW